MTYQLEIMRLGTRNWEDYPAMFLNIPDTCDPEVFLADFLESKYSAGAMLTASYKNPDVFAYLLPETELLPTPSVWRVRIVEIVDAQAHSEAS